ncbi:MAG TPA: hypothetical protein VH116_11420 [Gemmatimonadales bacterium]|jgi:hypothetical protein|nr:hypothetical protein [Gemmatimonadales bacterium]
MRALGLGVTVLAAIAVGCGGGHAIFNVDVYSFMAPKDDTVPYIVPPLSGVSVASPWQKISLPGAGSSLVDSIVILGTDSIHNASGGPGTIGLQLVMTADTTPGAPRDTALTVVPKPVSGAQTVPDTVRGRLRPGVDTLFTKSTIWAQVIAQGNNSSATALQGKMVLQSLTLTVVLTAKIF